MSWITETINTVMEYDFTEGETSLTRERIVKE